MPKSATKKARKKTGRSGATRTEDSGFSIPWAWLVIGILIGLFITFLINLPKQESGHNAGTASKKDTREVRQTSQPEVPPPPKEKFEFYTILPDMEVTLPDNFSLDNERESTANQNTSAPVESVTPSTANPSGNITTTEKVDNSLYQLQVGSFQDVSKADSLKAELALLGIETNIQAVTIKNGETWYRVRIGPTNDAKKITQIRQQLKAHDINAFMQKVKG